MVSWFSKKIYSLYKLISNKGGIIGLKLQHSVNSILSRPTKTYDFVIIDDLIPASLSGFRNYEFSYLLKGIKNSALFSLIITPLDKERYYGAALKTGAQFEKGKKAFTEVYDIAPDQVQPFFTWTKINAKLAYVLFVNNAHLVIDYLEQRKIRFIFELYPGGGFSLLEEGPTFDRLKRILSSPCLEKVIVTQKVTPEFVLKHKLCDPDKLVFKYGATLSPKLFDIPEKKIKYGENKNTLDICFTSAKYMAQGLDKGYDIFIDTAHLLLAKSNIYHFHIVGGFDENDWPIDPKYREHFHFYGFLKNEEFITFYEDKDIFITPSRAFTLGKGFFDGFPTAACSEASLNGLCVLFSDPLNLNIAYTNNEDTIFLENNPNQFAEIIINLTNNPSEIYRIGHNGKITTQNINKDHGEFRISLVKKCLYSND